MKKETDLQRTSSQTSLPIVVTQRRSRSRSAASTRSRKLSYRSLDQHSMDQTMSSSAAPGRDPIAARRDRKKRNKALRTDRRSPASTSSQTSNRKMKSLVTFPLSSPESSQTKISIITPNESLVYLAVGQDIPEADVLQQSKTPVERLLQPENVPQVSERRKKCHCSGRREIISKCRLENENVQLSVKESSNVKPEDLNATAEPQPPVALITEVGVIKSCSRDDCRSMEAETYIGPLGENVNYNVNPEELAESAPPPSCKTASPLTSTLDHSSDHSIARPLPSPQPSIIKSTRESLESQALTKSTGVGSFHALTESVLTQTTVSTNTETAQEEVVSFAMSKPPSAELDQEELVSIYPERRKGSSSSSAKTGSRRLSPDISRSPTREKLFKPTPQRSPPPREPDKGPDISEIGCAVTSKSEPVQRRSKQSASPGKNSSLDSGAASLKKSRTSLQSNASQAGKESQGRKSLLSLKSVNRSYNGNLSKKCSPSPDKNVDPGDGKCRCGNEPSRRVSQRLSPTLSDVPGTGQIEPHQPSYTSLTKSEDRDSRGPGVTPVHPEAPTPFITMAVDKKPSEGTEDIDASCTCRKCFDAHDCHCCGTCSCSAKRKPEDVPWWTKCDKYNSSPENLKNLSSQGTTSEQSAAYGHVLKSLFVEVNDTNELDIDHKSENQFCCPIETAPASESQITYGSSEDESNPIPLQSFDNPSNLTAAAMEERTQKRGSSERRRSRASIKSWKSLSPIPSGTVELSEDGYSEGSKKRRSRSKSLSTSSTTGRCRPPSPIWHRSPSVVNLSGCTDKKTSITLSHNSNRGSGREEQYEPKMAEIPRRSRSPVSSAEPEMMARWRRTGSSHENNLMEDSLLKKRQDANSGSSVVPGFSITGTPREEFTSAQYKSTFDNASVRGYMGSQKSGMYSGSSSFSDEDGIPVMCHHHHRKKPVCNCSEPSSQRHHRKRERRHHEQFKCTRREEGHKQRTDGSSSGGWPTYTLCTPNSSSSIYSMPDWEEDTSPENSLVTMPPLDYDEDYLSIMSSLPRTPVDIYEPPGSDNSVDSLVMSLDEERSSAEITRLSSDLIKKPELKQRRKKHMRAGRRFEKVEQSLLQSRPESPSNPRQSPSGASQHSNRVVNSVHGMSHTNSGITNVHTKKYECGCEEIIREYTTIMDGSCGKEACPCGCATQQAKEEPLPVIEEAVSDMATKSVLKNSDVALSKSESLCYCDDPVVIHCPDEKPCDCNFKCNCAEEWPKKNKEMMRSNETGRRVFVEQSAFYEEPPARQPADLHCPDEKACNCHFECDCPVKWPQMQSSEVVQPVPTCNCVAWGELGHKETQTSKAAISEPTSYSSQSVICEDKTVVTSAVTATSTSCRLYPYGFTTTTEVSLPTSSTEPSPQPGCCKRFFCCMGKKKSKSKKPKKKKSREKKKKPKKKKEKKKKTKKKKEKKKRTPKKKKEKKEKKKKKKKKK